MSHACQIRQSLCSGAARRIYGRSEKKLSNPARLSRILLSANRKRPNFPRKSLVRIQPSLGSIVVLAMDAGLIAQAGQISGRANWQLAFFGLSAFLFLRSDPETWPLGPVGFWADSCGSEYCCIVFRSARNSAGDFSNGASNGRVASGRARLIFPVPSPFSGALLLTHSHSLGTSRKKSSAELSHIPIAILRDCGMGRAGWNSPSSENQTRNAMARLWPLVSSPSELSC